MGLINFIACLFVFFFLLQEYLYVVLTVQVGLELVDIGDLYLLSAGIKRVCTTMPDEDSEFYSVSLH